VYVPDPQFALPEQDAVTVETIGDAVPVVPPPGRNTPFADVIDTAPPGVTTTVTALDVELRAMLPRPGLFVPGLADTLSVCADAVPPPNRQTSATQQSAYVRLIIGPS
jgi:hypothetical protein